MQYNWTLTASTASASASTSWKKCREVAVNKLEKCRQLTLTKKSAAVDDDSTFNDQVWCWPIRNCSVVDIDQRKVQSGRRRWQSRSTTAVFLVNCRLRFSWQPNVEWFFRKRRDFFHCSLKLQDLTKWQCLLSLDIHNFNYIDSHLVFMQTLYGTFKT